MSGSGLPRFRSASGVAVHPPGPCKYFMPIGFHASRLQVADMEGAAPRQPLCIDLFCGLGGWTEGFLAENYSVVGFDIERHQYGDQQYPAQLVLQDVLTIHGSQFKDAAVIVASPPCQEFSYMAMPFSRGKQIAAALRGSGSFPVSYTGSRHELELTALFDACFRIQREACEAAGRYIPLIVENVKGAQPWVGPAKAHFGSFYLWGDVGMVGNAVVAGGLRFGESVRPKKSLKGKTNFHYFEKTGMPSPSWHGAEHEPSVARALDSIDDGRKVPGIKLCEVGFNVAAAQRYREGQKTTGHVNKRDGHSHTRHLTNQRESDAVKVSGDWFGSYADMKANGTISPGRLHGKGSDSRKAASAQIAKIPLALSSYIARVFKLALKDGPA